MRGLFPVLPALLLLVSCGGDSTGPAPAPEPEYEVVAEGDVDEGGGTVGDGTVEVSVPAGAVQDQTTLKILSSTGDRPFGDDGDGVVYRLEGLPADFAEPLTVTLRPETPVSAEPMVGVGRLALCPSAGEERMGYMVRSATAQGDSLLTFELAPSPGAAKDTPTIAAVAFLYLIGYDTYFSEHDHFAVAFPSGVTASQAAEVGIMLEEIYVELGEGEGLGFSYANRTHWPILVVLKELESTVFGYSYALPNDYNAGWLELNTLKLGDAADMRISAGHEFFHLVQTWYYPADGWTIWKYLWLEEACAVWSESVFGGNPGYVSPIRDGNEYEPFWGLANVSTSGKQNHGYGMSAAIKYLVDRFGESIVEAFFDGVHANEGTADCLLNVIGVHESPALWWPDFLSLYCENAVVSDMPAVDLARSLVHSSQRFAIAAPEDTLRSFTWEYMDLSARMFRVNLDKDEWDPNKELFFSLSGDDGHGDLTVWSYGSGPLVRLAGLAGGVQQVGDLQALHDANRDLLVLVTNTRAVAPYTSVRDITLEVHLKGPDEILESYEVSCWSDLLYMRDSSEGPWNSGSSEIVITNGAFTGNTFVGTDVNMFGDRDSIRVTVDPVQMKVVDFEVFAWKGNNRTDVPVYRLEGAGEIDLVKDQHNRYVARAEGAAACALIDHVSGHYDPDTNDWWYTILGCTCEPDSYVEFRFYF